MPHDQPVTYRLDLLEFLQQSRTEDSEPATTPPAPALTKEQRGMFKRDTKRWEAYTTGNAYMLYVQNRTMSHSFRVVAHGKTPVDAVKRWYRGLDGRDKQTRKAVRVVAVHACADTAMTKASDLLMGTQQNSFPY